MNETSRPVLRDCNNLTSIVAVGQKNIQHIIIVLTSVLVATLPLGNGKFLLFSSVDFFRMTSVLWPVEVLV